MASEANKGLLSPLLSELAKCAPFFAKFPFCLVGAEWSQYEPLHSQPKNALARETGIKSESVGIRPSNRQDSACNDAFSSDLRCEMDGK